MPIFNRIYSIFIISLILTACNRNKSITDIEVVDTEISHIKIDISSDYYNESTSSIPQPEIIILNEDDKSMFIDIDRIIEANGLFFIIDSYSARTALSFTKDGQPYARYGSVGQGPGEYTFPWDIDIWNDTVFILDANSKKLIKYDQSGKFISELNIPFTVDAFKVLDNGNILFNLMPTEDQGPSLCLSDSSLNNLKYMLPYPKGYKGGFHTPDVFRESNGKLTYYKSPSDTLYVIDKYGLPEKSIVFDFKSKGLPEDVKLDFSLRDSSESDLWLVNNPIHLYDDLWIGLVEDGDQQYTVLFSEETNKCGGRVFSDKSSVYDPIEPIGTDSNGNLFCLLNYEIAYQCADFASLSNEIKQQFENGNRALLIYRNKNL